MEFHWYVTKVSESEYYIPLATVIGSQKVMWLNQDNRRPSLDFSGATGIELYSWGLLS